MTEKFPSSARPLPAWMLSYMPERATIRAFRESDAAPV
jgi:hypothetical protein